ncbi:582_t:CDS:2 [Paraglomus occultum]|uniref:Succinate dehydrogenase [ubiquinone] cytochrome b small subunit n=1 Tax=Paraglomus occultum TaxID=144539 RepID=A0A9N9AZL2_9GLOM|nr:582_t:CDS:2 [Paraglomus occultum]
MAFRLVNSTIGIAPRLNQTVLGLKSGANVRAVTVFQIANFHASRAAGLQTTKVVRDGASFIKGSVNDAVVLPARDKFFGSYHWFFERSLSISLIPLTAASIVQGAHPITDLLLGVVLPIHCHVGFDAIITDYLPTRRAPTLHKLSTWGLRGATLLVLIGCYQFNTNDVGMTELVKRVWHA